MGAQCCSPKGTGPHEKILVPDRFGRARQYEIDTVLSKKKFAVMVAGEQKMLRCAPQTGTPYIPGCHISIGTTVEVSQLEKGDKYALVRSHGMVGFLRRRHLCMLPLGDPETLRRRRIALLAFWVMVKKGCGDMLAVEVLGNMCVEMVPWWLLPGQGTTHAERYSSKQMTDDCLKRSLASPVSSVRRKELAKSLSQWKVEFTRINGRGPHALDVWTDSTVQKMYEEYEMIGKHRHLDRCDNLTPEQHARFRVLCKKLKVWMTKYEEQHSRLPSKKRILADPEVSGIYTEYLALSGKRKDRGSSQPHGGEMRSGGSRTVRGGMSGEEGRGESPVHCGDTPPHHNSEDEEDLSLKQPPQSLPRASSSYAPHAFRPRDGSDTETHVGRCADALSPADANVLSCSPGRGAVGGMGYSPAVEAILRVETF